MLETGYLIKTTLIFSKDCRRKGLGKCRGSASILYDLSTAREQEIIVSDQSKRTTQYEWAKAMKADLLIIVRQVAWKLSEPELTELYRLWRHWCAEVERLAPD
jgi:hypothetical protein